MAKKSRLLVDSHRTSYAPRTERRTASKSRKRGMAKTHAYY